MKRAPSIRQPGSAWPISCALALIAFESAGAPLTLAPYFSSNMILQRGEKTRVWGTGTPGNWIRVEVANQGKKGDVKKNGVWSVDLEDLKAARSATNMSVTDTTAKEKPSIQLTNVLVGDILLVGISDGVGISIASEPLAEARTGVRFLNLTKVVNEETAGAGGYPAWETPGAGRLSALALRTALEFAARPEMKSVPLGIVVADLSKYKGRLINSVNPDIPFPHEAWRTAKNDVKEGQNAEAGEFLKLKREGKRSDRPPLMEYRQMYFHLWEDFDPKNAPASVFKFKWVFTEY